MRGRKQVPASTMSVTLMDFYADWCGPCKTQDPILEDIKEEWGERFELERVNVDEDQATANIEAALESAGA